MKKGTTNNPNGRPKGTPNKSTKEMRDFLQAFVEDNLESLQSEFDELEGADKFRVIEKLLPYILPKHNSISLQSIEQPRGKNLPSWLTDDDEQEKTKIDYSKVSDETLEALIESQKNNE